MGSLSGKLSVKTARFTPRHKCSLTKPRVREDYLFMFLKQKRCCVRRTGQALSSPTAGERVPAA